MIRAVINHSNISKGVPMKKLSLLDNSLEVTIFYEPSDSEYDDNICICFEEFCQEEEKILIAGETNIFLTPDQANQFAMALIEAAKQSLGYTAAPSDAPTAD